MLLTCESKQNTVTNYIGINFPVITVVYVDVYKRQPLMLINLVLSYSEKCNTYSELF